MTVHMPNGEQVPSFQQDSQPTLRTRAQTVRRAADAIRRIHDEQVSMWEAFWRSNRFPVNHR